jgi:hypothetical protein
MSVKTLSNSADVSLVESEFVKLIDLIQDKQKERRKEMHIETSIESEVGLYLLYGSVHYCFVHPKTKREYVFFYKGKKYFRSHGFITALKQSQIKWDDFFSISKLDIETWYSILQTANEKDLFQLRKRYFRIIMMAKFLLKNDISNASIFIQEFNSAEKILELLYSSALFDDYFLKRAQVTTNLISMIYEKNSLQPFEDLKILTAMPDYRIPQLLYNIGVIDISDEIKNKLINRELIMKNSNTEMVLRSSVVVVAEILSKHLKLPEATIDSLLWSISQDKIKIGNMEVPAMLVETDCY